MIETDNILIGVDAGGTKTRLLVKGSTQASTRLHQGKGINLKRDGISGAAAQLAALINLATVDHTDSAPLFLCAGIAGAGRQSDRQNLEQELSSLLRPRSLSTTICTDADIAYYAAHEDNPGILIIAGTGSIILAKTVQGDFVRAGGWGYKLGDEAGGYQLGQAGLSAVANHMDGGPPTMLTALIEKSLQISGADELISFTYDPETRIQDVAPLVLTAAQQEDQIAMSIVDRQLDLLATRLRWMVTSNAGVNPNVCIFGGLSGHPYYLERLKARLTKVAPDISFSPMQLSPVEAALRLASKMVDKHL